jgi:arsenate reductase
VAAERFAHQRLEDLTRATNADHRPQVLFVCVANAGRSQLAAALLHHYAGDAVVARSAGSAPARDIHASVRTELADLGIDTQAGEVFPKPLTDDAVRAADVVITMGCGDTCPILPGTRYEDWAVGDPALASPEGVAAIRADIDQRVRALLGDLVPGLHLPTT